MSKGWRAASSVAIFLTAAVLLYLSLRGIQWDLVRRTVANIRAGYASLSVAIGMLPLLLRGVRWQVLLQAKAPVLYRTAFWAVSAGYFGNNFLPVRGGEFVRSYIVRERSQLSLSYILATVLTERVADAVALVLIGALVLRSTLHRSFLFVGLAGMVFLVVLPLVSLPASRMLHRWPRLHGAFEQILLGVRSLHDVRRLGAFIALTAAIWLLDALSTAAMAHALSLNVTLRAAMLLIVALSLSSALPSAPGYVGVYQFVAVAVLKPFGISSSAALAFILVTQAFSYVVTGAFGLLAITHFTPFKFRSFRQPLQPIQTQS